MAPDATDFIIVGCRRSGNGVDSELVESRPGSKYLLVHSIHGDVFLSDGEELVSCPPASLATVTLEVVLVCLNEEPVLICQSAHIDDRLWVLGNDGAFVTTHTCHDKEDRSDCLRCEEAIVGTLI